MAFPCYETETETGELMENGCGGSEGCAMNVKLKRGIDASWASGEIICGQWPEEKMSGLNCEMKNRGKRSGGFFDVPALTNGRGKASGMHFRSFMVQFAFRIEAPKWIKSAIGCIKIQFEAVFGQAAKRCKSVKSREIERDLPKRCLAEGQVNKISLKNLLHGIVQLIYSALRFPGWADGKILNH